MNFINNWVTQLTAPLSAASTVLPIPPSAAARLDLTGVYYLTLVNSLNPLEQTLWEIIEVSAGLQLKRGQDGTSAKSWPSETVIYCALTAGQLKSLQDRIVALESASSEVDGALTDGSGNTLTDDSNNILVEV